MNNRMSASLKTNKAAAPVAAHVAAPVAAPVAAKHGQTYDMMKDFPLEVFLVISIFSGIVFYKTGSFPAVVLVILVISMGAYFMGLWIGVPTTFPIQFAYDAIPEPAPAKKEKPSHPVKSAEVFYVSGNNYTYADASNVCAAYNSVLATHDQLVDAYGKGADWCGYGWTDGGMALYPTQEATWSNLQKSKDDVKSKSCGVPGVNGGYFDLTTKFGVNCFGVKPEGSIQITPPVEDPAAKATKAAIDKLKKDLTKLKVLPFNHSGWSEWNA